MNEKVPGFLQEFWPKTDVPAPAKYKQLGIVHDLRSVTFGVPVAQRKTKSPSLALHGVSELVKQRPVKRHGDVLVGEARIVDGKIVMDDVEDGIPDDTPEVPLTKAQRKAAQRRAAEQKKAGGKTPAVLKMEELASQATKAQMHLSESQFQMVRKLIAKHGQNVEAMSRDLRRNPYQLTVGQLKRLLVNYEEYKGYWEQQLHKFGLNIDGVPVAGATPAEAAANARAARAAAAAAAAAAAEAADVAGDELSDEGASES